MATKYKEYFDKMISENKEAFDAFTAVHFEYSIDQDKNQEKFNKAGEKILEIIHDYENRLCKNTESGIYNQYSGGLSEKFQALIKSHFPLIDHIGLIVEYEPQIASATFNLKKINLG